ncbi:hypothetical protein TIFTF001_036540 [Ficus carica]|uniref:Uncharacterized protein n=1 Tax=Ficus carica TaxID=3494 RepID=A0AA88E4K9_FICCA|nr:hypothetical protein TIFTF001_036540 [Ficus carica]
MSQEIACSTRFLSTYAPAIQCVWKPKGVMCPKVDQRQHLPHQAYLTKPTSSSLPHQGKACSPRLAITGHAS